MPRSTKLVAIALAAVAVLLASPRQAEARPLIFYTTGEDAFVAGDGSIPEAYRPWFDGLPDAKGAQAGYRCKIFGLFWAYMHWWDCKPVVFTDNTSTSFTFWDDDTADGGALKGLGEAIEKAHPSGDMKMGFWQKFGRFVIGGVLLLLIVLAIARAVKKKPKTA